MFQKTIASLPTEIIEDILVQLPIGESLIDVSLASKQLLAPFLFGSLSFSRRHLNCQLSTSNHDSILDYIDSDSIEGHIPSMYQTALFNEIKTTDPDFNFCIQWASEQGHVTLVDLILRQGKAIDPSANDDFAFRMACTHGHFEVAKLLISHSYVNPGAHDNWAIQWASQGGHTEIVELLLADGRANPAAGNHHAIRYAAMNGHVNVLKLLLLDGRVDPTSVSNWAVRVAAEEGHLGTVRVLMKDPRVNPADNQDYALRMALENGHGNVVALLLEDPRVDRDSRLARSRS
ncbi:UNVERIFIED_CONTAM: hypothetical protein HDU68_003324 [Siphonaria sp. JEL0065]|nr:hypothetical protein HDU68_003324 [Siphonaria sp. JEL0065]